MTSIYDFTLLDIQAKPLSLQKYEGKTLLFVNVASTCGFTSQYEELENLYQKYKARGLVILGFPCNQFGFQESGSNDEISSFCTLNYGISFPMFSKIKVNGKETDPLYTFLKEEKPGLLGSKDIKWNFTKFLVNKEGTVLERFAPSSTPISFEDKIKDIL